jgi:hypothetical protein
MPFCYIIQTGYEEFLIRKTLKQAILARRENFDNASHAWESSQIDVQYNDDSKENVDLKPFILQIEITEEKKKEIDGLVEKEIEKTEEYIRTIKYPCTGYFGITRDRKDWAVQNEIKNASFVWNEEKISNLQE